MRFRKDVIAGMVRAAMVATLATAIAVPGVQPASALAASGLGASAPVASAFDPSVARRISAANVRRRQQRKAKIIFLDTRSTIDGDVIDGAVNVPVDLIGAWARRVPKTALIVAYCTCEDDGLSIEAVLSLQRLGFTNAFVLSGGLDAARGAGIRMGHLAH